MFDYSNAKFVDAWWEAYGKLAVGREAVAGEVTRNSRAPSGGWAPVFLQGHDWAMRSIPHGRHSMENLLEAQPGSALTSLKDDGNRVWYIPGLETLLAFLTVLHIGINMDRGIGLVMKRLSRLLVDFRVAAYLAESSVRVRYTRYGLVRSKAYDGSACFSRAFVKRLARERIAIEFTPLIAAYKDLLSQWYISLEQRAELTREVKKLQRLVAHIWREALTIQEGEFDLVGNKAFGFWKGQAKVVETREWDVLLPHDGAKKEVWIEGDRIYAGIKPISAHDFLFLDRQSMSNLNNPPEGGVFGFFSYDPLHPTEDRLIRWLDEHLHAHKAAVDDGRFNELMVRKVGKLAWETDVEKHLNFFLNRYTAMGGDVRWFRRTLFAAYKIGLDPIVSKQKGTAFPVPGLRLYVRPASMGNRHVKRGQVAWDLKRGVVYVNDVDAVTFDPRFKTVNDLELWLKLAGNTFESLLPGLMPRLGGYDNDDAFCIVPFIDWDGRRRVLVSRQPQMPGERWIAEYLSGDVPEDEGYWFNADSRRLRAYSHPPIDPLYAIQPYAVKAVDFTIDAINATARAMVKSAPAVGMFCLMLRLLILTEGDLPAMLPAYTEAVIDASVKTFDDVSGVIRWAQDQAKRLVEEGKPVPQLILKELIKLLPNSWKDAGRLPVECPPETHWVDIQTKLAADVIAAFQAEIKNSANLATPPQELFDHAMGWAEPGLVLRGTYGRVIREAHLAESAAPEVTEDDPDFFQQMENLAIDDVQEAFADMSDDEKSAAIFEHARQNSVGFLEMNVPAEEWGMVLAGGLAATYLEHMAMRNQQGMMPVDPSNIKDSAFFQLGRKLLIGREPGLDQVALEGLVQVGVLRDLEWDGQQLLKLDMRELTPLAGMTTLHIKHGWFNLGIARREIKPTTEMRKLSPALVEQLKERFARLNLVGVTFKAESRKMSVGIRQEDRDVLVSIGTGNVLGLLGADVNVTKLPAVMKVVHARTDTATMDETWLMMASV